MENNKLKEYLDSFQNGDRSAFEKIYNDMKVPVYTVAYRITQTRECAEDVTQEVFLKLFSSPPDVTVKNPRAWIFRITHNTAIDALRKSKKQSQYELNEFSSDDGFSELIVMKLDIDRVMRRLDSESRAIVTLHLNAGLSFSQTAQTVGKSLSATYRIYRKAMKRLRDLTDGG